MAIITAVKNGNWSDPTVWDSGTLPQSGDTAKPGAFAVVIDQDVDLGAGALEGTAGLSGYFRVNTGGITITANISVGAGTPGIDGFLRYYHTLGAGSCSHIGEVLGGQTTAYAIRIHGTGGLQQTGDIRGGSANSALGIVSTLNTQPMGDIDVIGDVCGGAGVNAGGLYTAYARNVSVIGNVIADESYGLQLLAPGLSEVIIAGDVIASVRSLAIYLNASNSPVVNKITVMGSIIAAVAEINNFPFGIVAIDTYGNACVVARGPVIDSPDGAPAVAGIVLRDVANPQSYIDLPYIDPATDEITTERLWRRPGRILPIRGGLG